MVAAAGAGVGGICLEDALRLRLMYGMHELGDVIDFEPLLTDADDVLTATHDLEVVIIPEQVSYHFTVDLDRSDLEFERPAHCV